MERPIAPKRHDPFVFIRAAARLLAVLVLGSMSSVGHAQSTLESEAVEPDAIEGAAAEPGAAEPEAVEPEAAELETAPEEILVTGEFPGPGMWKVTRVDDPENHILWILGTPPPLPKKMKWKSTEVERVMRAADEILLGASVQIDPDQRIGFFKGLSLLPAALAARKNPEKQQLKDVLPPDVYERWLVWKQKYLGRRSSIEKWRPIFAAAELADEAFDDLKLQNGNVVAETVAKIAKKHDLKTTVPKLELTFEAKNIRAKIKEFSREQLSDVECLSRTLDLVEAISDRETMDARAAAWATGDLKTFAALPELPNPFIACIAAVMSSQVAHEIVPDDLFAQLDSLWLEAAERSLATNKSTFAILSLANLTSPTGQLAKLRAKGYLVEEPERQ